MTLMARIQRNGPLQRLMHSQAVKRAGQCNQRDPLEAQQQIFRELVEKAAATQFGKEYGFARLTNQPFDKAYHHYKGRVPIRSYHEFMTDYFIAISRPYPSGVRPRIWIT